MAKGSEYQATVWSLRAGCEGCMDTILRWITLCKHEMKGRAPQSLDL